MVVSIFSVCQHCVAHLMCGSLGECSVADGTESGTLEMSADVHDAQITGLTRGASYVFKVSWVHVCVCVCVCVALSVCVCMWACFAGVWSAKCMRPCFPSGVCSELCWERRACCDRARTGGRRYAVRCCAWPLVANVSCLCSVDSCPLILQYLGCHDLA